jgi:hypothetical protein
MRAMVGNKAAMYDPEFLRRCSLHDCFGNFDELFDLFCNNVRMDDVAKANGVRVKKQHTLVEKWPYRVTPRTTKQEFEIMPPRVRLDGSGTWSLEGGVKEHHLPRLNVCKTTRVSLPTFDARRRDVDPIIVLSFSTRSYDCMV